MYITASKSFTGNELELRGENFPQKVWARPELQRGLASGFKNIAMNSISLLLDTETKRQLKSKAGERSGLIMASGASEWEGNGALYTQVAPDYSFKFPYLLAINVIAGKIANEIGFHGYVSSDCSSCISSYKAIQEAWWLMQTGQLDRVLILGIDDQINSFVLEVFGSLEASLSHDMEVNHGIKPSAFDDENGGFHLAHGGGMLLLEKEADEYLARITGIGIGSEPCSNAVGMLPTGDGYERVLRRALGQANELKKIDFIKTHGTGTKTNNNAESAALRSIFGDTFIATSYKPEIGHTLGASGAVEIDIALADARQGRIRGIHNRTCQDPLFISEDRQASVDSIVALGAGMGNVFAAVVLQDIQKT